VRRQCEGGGTDCRLPDQNDAGLTPFRYFGLKRNGPSFG